MVTLLRRFGRQILLLFMIPMLLSGCMYQTELERQTANPAVVREEIGRVQGAVDEYVKNRKLPPIKNSDESTPIYEKYIIDLRKLVESKYLSGIPKNAFESGGNYYYVLVDVETEPKVKLMDLVAFQTAADLERTVAEYARANGGKLPLGARLSDGFHAVDFKALDMDAIQVRSMYSNNYLPFVLQESGRIAIDYGMEVMGALQKQGIDSPDPKMDLREVLVSGSHFVPVRSFPYVWRDGQPVVTGDPVKQ
ncbi:DUF3939 domain-containing protein [Paenibacillus alkalitolerans]|uniref:DUF3939 domain-containing protein n=1 Tax=Paenibacillus alkalitolerans TaxID=2799335 RepID=UPI0018F3E1AE|nr:DUF3939 domain-containing protein [Paenibacillus alkalitolerans]